MILVNGKSLTAILIHIIIGLGNSNDQITSTPTLFDCITHSELQADFSKNGCITPGKLTKAPRSYSLFNRNTEPRDYHEGFMLRNEVSGQHRGVGVVDGKMKIHDHDTGVNDQAREQ